MNLRQANSEGSRQKHQYQGPINLMDLGLEEESLEGDLFEEESSLVDKSGDRRFSDDRDGQRGTTLLRHASAAGLVLTAMASLLIGIIVGSVTHGWNHNNLSNVDLNITEEEVFAGLPRSGYQGPARPVDLIPNATSNNLTHPSLSEIVQNGTIVGDVSWEIDFSIIGFPKSGTSYLMRYLSLGEELYLHDHELCTLTFNDPVELVKLYHNVQRVTKDGQRKIKAGLKCPKDSESDWGLQHYSDYWPNTDFIITTRHPISWFQSFYNYRSYQHYPRRMPPPLDLIGPCRENHPGQICAHHVTPKEECNRQNVCTDRGNYHYALSRLQKTPMTSERERNLLKGRTMSAIDGLMGRVFIMEVGQLSLEGVEAERFTMDLSDYLGMDKPLPPFPPHNAASQYPDEERRQDFINICDDMFIPIRAQLLEHGRDASDWIENYFLKSDQVYVSQRAIFVEMIRKWSIDPCENVEAL